ncbi:MAG: hypothetical protein B7Z75_12185 [Acidocella sp. 20-57-95]|nr:MAG: hypothetical protein B7Z75_12185 [Acidocella sp. 20-57-95]OYV62159.1 MAG: hypothetical protein B7Z71_02280 [Acidocella sp. 21-58-7]HQT65319.1 hypothetical protein [Acidocella sp.]HQU04341.1 hypothetical protein [Acidocella sp.]
MRLTATCLFATALLAAIAYLRPPEYDEAYSIFLTAGHARPLWPTGIFQPADVAALFHGPASLRGIAQDLRTGDVHPPVYFWALDLWRLIFGPSWFTARMFSVLVAIITLATTAKLAKLVKVPQNPVIIITCLAYGFAYTSTIARGFGLAECLNIIGFALVMRSRIADDPAATSLAIAAGLAFAAASFSNYLACFTAIATIGWFAFEKPRIAFSSACAFALSIPLDLSFFIDQHASRTGQFPPFDLMHATALLLRDEGAALFGGLPIYAGAAGPVVTSMLSIFSAACAYYVYRDRTPETMLLVVVASATPLGLLALGVIFDNTPIEIRYCAFSLPFIAILLAQSLPLNLRDAVMAIEVLAIIGLAIAPATMQPQGRAAHEAAANHPDVTLVPFGNDGVGIPGPFIAAAPPDMRIALVPGNILPDLTGVKKVTLATIGIDNASKAYLPALESQLAANWQLVNATSLTQTYVKRTANQQAQANQ